jgi:hypothetical protein
MNFYYPYCPNHSPDGYPDWIPSNLINRIPTSKVQCLKCKNKSIYLGYIDPDFKKFRSHLIHQLKYSAKHSQCQCLWPEYSPKAAKISDAAYLLFRNLLTTTALSELLEDEKKQKKFLENPGWFLNKHGLTISFIAQQLSNSIELT